MNNQPERLTRKGSKHAQPAIRRVQIIRAAMISFGANGYANTTIDSIGKQAKLSKGSVYRFFTSKDELLLATIDYIQDEFETRCKELANGKTPIQQLECFFKASTESIINQREIVGFLIQVLSLDFTQKKITTCFNNDLAMLNKIVSKGVETGSFPQSTVKSVPTAILALINGHLLLAHIFQGSEEEWLEKVELSWQLIKSQLV